MSDKDKAQVVVEMMKMMADDRIVSFIDANRFGVPEAFTDHFAIAEMEPFNPEVPASRCDTYHTYTIIGQNASNTTHHHEFGDVTVFFGETSNVDFHGKPVHPQKRYVIIADQHTGQRLKVWLPEIERKDNESV